MAVLLLTSGLCAICAIKNEKPQLLLGLLSILPCLFVIIIAVVIRFSVLFSKGEIIAGKIRYFYTAILLVFGFFAFILVIWTFVVVFNAYEYLHTKSRNVVRELIRNQMRWNQNFTQMMTMS